MSMEIFDWLKREQVNEALKRKKKPKQNNTSWKQGHITYTKCCPLLLFILVSFLISRRFAFLALDYRCQGLQLFQDFVNIFKINNNRDESYCKF